ncbi:MAG: ImmA/IrrE family metallo-endopeptidase [Flavobacteriaceae bacterium]|nr:ImmA/IrrE family metallo-endopeptidase [Flavobacteriaceae bacterium]
MIEFKPEKLSRSKIQQLTEEFRSYYKYAKKVPVEVEELIELELKIEIIPDFGLKQKAGVEAFISKNLKQIRVDNNEYQRNTLSNRYRFTLAEEIGHLWLHRKIYEQGVRYDSTEEFINDYKKMDEDDLNWIEFQAREFAGRLLVPKDVLELKILEMKEAINKFHEKYNGSDESIDLVKEPVAKKICHHFGVSWEVIRNRFRAENLEHMFLPE